MKRSFLFRAAAAACVFAAVLAGTGCSQDADTTAAVSDETVVAAVKKALEVGYASGDSASSVTQNVTLVTADASYGTVTISWSSANAAVIAADGTVTLPDADTAVTLTAKISCGSSSDTKDFALTVIGKAKAEVLGKLAVTYADGDSAASVTKDVTLSSYTVTWKSNHGKNISSAGAVARDIIDVPVTLTATVTDGTDTIGTRSFTLTVKQVPQVTYKGHFTDKYEFTGTTITYTSTYNGSTTSSSKFTFTADTDNGTLSAAKTEATINGTSYTKDTYTAYLKKSYTQSIDVYKKLSEDTAVTYDELIAGFKTIMAAAGAGTYTEAEIAKNCYRQIYGEDSTVTDYAAALKGKPNLTDDVHAFLKKGLKNLGCSSWDEAQSVSYAMAEKIADGTFCTRTYKYALKASTDTTDYPDGYIFSSEQVYDTSKTWWNQSLYVNYRNDNVSFSCYSYNSSSSGELSCNGSYKSGTFNSDYTVFTETDSGATWNITSDGKGTLTLVNGSTSYTLSFDGGGLY
jgi:hypothetical protein